MLELVPLLEFMRVAGIDRSSVVEVVRQMLVKIDQDPNYDPTLDETLKPTAYAALGSSRDAAGTFSNWLELSMSQENSASTGFGVPGWDDNQCRLNLFAYACFCNGAAMAFLNPYTGATGPEALDNYLKAYKKTTTDVGETETTRALVDGCNANVLADPFYNEVSGSLYPEEKASILPWVGAGAIALFGLGWLAFRKG